MKKHLNLQRSEYLSYKYMEHSLSEEENTEFLNWLNDDAEIVLDIPAKVANTEGELKSSIFSGILLKTRLEAPSSLKIRLLHRNWKVVAISAACLVIVIGFVTLWENKHYNKLVNIAIKPGKFNATLILSDGHKISLLGSAKEEISVQSGVRVTKTAEGKLQYLSGSAHSGGLKYNTLVTSPGEEYEVLLPDHTRARLNASSSISFPVSFHGLANRQVTVRGEVYFEVSKDRVHPFIVSTAKQRIEVLGTHFDVVAYPDEKSEKTVLAEGSVKVTPMDRQLVKASGEAVMLRPSELSIVENGKAVVTKADLAEELAWVRGDFIFNEEPLGSVLRKLSRWYDVEFIISSDQLKNIEIGGFLSRSKPISDVLERIQKTAHIKFEVKGRKIYVSP